MYIYHICYAMVCFVSSLKNYTNKILFKLINKELGGFACKKKKKKKKKKIVIIKNKKKINE